MTCEFRVLGVRGKLSCVVLQSLPGREGHYLAGHPADVRPAVLHPRGHNVVEHNGDLGAVQASHVDGVCLQERLGPGNM